MSYLEGKDDYFEPSYKELLGSNSEDYVDLEYVFGLINDAAQNYVGVTQTIYEMIFVLKSSIADIDSRLSETLQRIEYRESKIVKELCESPPEGVRATKDYTSSVWGTDPQRVQLKKDERTLKLAKARAYALKDVLEIQLKASQTIFENRHDIPPTGHIYDSGEVKSFVEDFKKNAKY